LAVKTRKTRRSGELLGISGSNKQLWRCLRVNFINNHQSVWYT
jgi:hypothetical protein